MKGKRVAKWANFVSPNEKAKSEVIAQLVRIARKARLGDDDFLYVSQQTRRQLGLRRVLKLRPLPQLLTEAELKRFFRAIQDCGDVQHEILLKLLFYTAVRVSELVHIKVAMLTSMPAKFSSMGAKAPRTATFCFRRASAWCSKATCTPRRAIDIYSRPGGSGGSRHAESSKLFKAIARRPALRSRCTRICSATRCCPT